MYNYMVISRAETLTELPGSGSFFWPYKSLILHQQFEMWVQHWRRFVPLPAIWDFSAAMTAAVDVPLLRGHLWTRRGKGGLFAVRSDKLHVLGFYAVTCGPYLTWHQLNSFILKVHWDLCEFWNTINQPVQHLPVLPLLSATIITTRISVFSSVLNMFVAVLRFLWLYMSPLSDAINLHSQC